MLFWDLGEDATDWMWKQYGNMINDAGTALDIHLIDLDELHTIKRILRASFRGMYKETFIGR